MLRCTTIINSLSEDKARLTGSSLKGKMSISPTEIDVYHVREETARAVQIRKPGVSNEMEEGQISYT
jgi:hypothetical protein